MYVVAVIPAWFTVSVEKSGVVEIRSLYETAFVTGSHSNVGVSDVFVTPDDGLIIGGGIGFPGALRYTGSYQQEVFTVYALVPFGI